VRHRFRPAALVAALCATLLGFAGPAGAVMADSIPITGRGWGHGRGMGQWGSYGYALAGWNSAQILDHYYGGTTSGTIPNVTIGTKLSDFDGSTPMFWARDRNLRTSATGSNQYDGVHIAWNASTARLEIWSYPDKCVGQPTLVTTTTSAVTLSIPGATPESDDPGHWIGVCNYPGASRYFRGTMGVVHLDGFGTRTYNQLPIEQYLKGVVPRESPADWGNTGGMAALRAQAVAARSYAFTFTYDPRAPGYFDTCDSQQCQVYGGTAKILPNGSIESLEHPRTNEAIAQTAGQVRVRNGVVQRTEFSSSTGGWTAGGTFPAVIDQGDATPGNTNQTWSTTVNRSTIEAIYSGGRGQLLDLCVVGRNGLGADGGRVTTVRMTFVGGTVDEAGDDFRWQLGLKSDWFSTPCGVGRYIDRVAQIFTGQTASPSTANAWTSAVQSGNRAGFTYGLAVSDAWAGYEIDQLYQRVFGRPADAQGRAYWVGVLANGARLEDVALWFYSGDEYWAKHGSTATGFVNALYQDLLHRQADASGRNYWVGMLQSGSLGRVGVAAGFYASMESRRDRVGSLFQRVLGRAPDAGGHAYWAGELPRLGDMWLAAYLAASDEAFSRYSAP